MTRTLLAILAVLTGFLLTITVYEPADAQQPEPDLHLGFVESVTAGEPVIISAYLVDPAGNPIRGVPINLSRNATFLNISGGVSLGTRLTDVTGLATVTYSPATEGEIAVTATFSGTEVFAPATASRTLEVMPGPGLYREVSPFRVPGTNVWMVVGILTAIWSVYLVAFGAMFRIGRASDA
ncbi:MAG: Ig-like domain-containing protein [Planctomycetota bacterium]